MAANDLESLHRRYVDLAGRFKSAWTFHQFLQGVQKLFPEIELASYPADFQEVHAGLRDVAANLSNSGAAERLSTQMNQIERQLVQMVQILAAADGRIEPSTLRQFFDRVKNFDDQILAQMVRFYLSLPAADEGLKERFDKVDFLVTKVAEEAHPATGVLGLRDMTRLREILQGLWSAVEGSAGPVADLDAARATFAELRREVGAVADLEGLTSRGLIDRHRRLKQSLGVRLFHPETLIAAIETNLAFKNKVKQFYRLEEQRIASDSQQIFELESKVPVDRQLDADLSQFRLAVEDFEKKQRRDNVKLQDLAFLRRQSESILPRLTGGGADRAGMVHGGPAGMALSAEEKIGSPTRPASDGDVVARQFKDLVAALEGTDANEPPKTVALAREIYHLRLEPREVVAYRRLISTGEGDSALEQFILEAAALRLRINEEAAEITALLDETSVTRSAPIFTLAKQTTRVADAFVQRFGHFIDVTIQEGNFGEAQQLQLLRMRLIRDYSGLWLLVNRPQTS